MQKMQCSEQHALNAVKKHSVQGKIYPAQANASSATIMLSVMEKFTHFNKYCRASNCIVVALTVVD